MCQKVLAILGVKGYVKRLRINLFGEGRASDPLDTERFAEQTDIPDVVSLHQCRRHIKDEQDQQDAIVLLLSLGIPAKFLRLVKRTHNRGLRSCPDHVPIKKMLAHALGHCDLKTTPKKELDNGPHPVPLAECHESQLFS